MSSVQGEFASVEHQPTPPLPLVAHRRHLGWVAAGASIAVALAGCSGPFSDGQNASETCPAPSTKAIQSVTKLFDEKSKAPDQPRNWFGFRPESSDLFLYKAREIGITFPRHNRDEQSHLELASSQAESASPFSDYLRDARKVLDQSHIGIRVGPPEGRTEFGEKPTPKDLRSATAKYRVVELAKMFSNEPIQLTSNLGIKEINLVAKAKNAGQVDNHHMYFSITGNAESAAPAGHEMTHIIQAVWCSPASMWDDPGYSSLNKTARYAGTYPLPPKFKAQMPKTYSEILEEKSQLEGEKLDYTVRGDKQNYCRTEAKLSNLLKSVEMYGNDYSYTNVAEDEANVGSGLLDTSGDAYAALLDKRSPVLRSKAIYELARMYEKQPNVVRYLALNAVQPNKPAFNCTAAPTIMQVAGR